MTRVDDRSALPPHPRKLFQNLSREHDFEPVALCGAPPPPLAGTLYRNGVGLMESFGRRYDHLFQADGAIHAFRFSPAGVSVAARLVQTRGLVEERAAGQHLGSLSASWPQRALRTLTGRSKNTANTHVVPYREQLLALMEGGKPTRIDSASLATLGETDLGGVVTGTFSAHPHRVARRHALYNFGMTYGRETALVVYEMPDEGSPRVVCRLPLEHPLMVHDFAATEKHIVFFLGPAKLRIWRILLALRGFDKNVQWAPELGTEIVVVPIDSPEKVVRFRVDPFWVFHFAGAFEDRGEVVVDYVRYADSCLLDALGDGSGLSWAQEEATPPARLHRARIDPAQRKFSSIPRGDFQCEFPRISPSAEGARFDNLWLQSEAYVAGVLRFQVTRVDEQGKAHHLQLEPGQICGEPVPIESPEGGGGASSVVTVVFDSFAETSFLLVVNASTLSIESKIELPRVVPLTFHGSWVPSA